MEQNESWHLDKRVPVALIFTLLAQFAGGVWFLSAAFSDIEANRTAIQTIDGRVGMVERAANTQAVQLGRIEESLQGLRSDINRLLSLLERQYK